MSSAPHLLIIEARFYEDIADALYEGAAKALNDAGATHDRITVPGVLEIPAGAALTGWPDPARLMGFATAGDSAGLALADAAAL